MTDDINATVLRVHYRRQIQPKQYETAEFSCDVEHSFPAGMSPEEIEKSAKRMAQEVKVVVLDQLGLDYTQDDETRIIMEAFPASQSVARTTKPSLEPIPEHMAPEPATAPLQEPEPDNVPSLPPKPSTARRRAPAPTGEDGTAALWEDLAKNPSNWFDNTENKQNPKAPDFRATKKSGFMNGSFPAGLWLNTKPEDLVIPDEGYAGAS